jgi:hypothetical protein
MTAVEKEYIYPSSYEALSFASFQQALHLDRAQYSIKYEAAHPPEGMTEFQVTSRAALLEVSRKIIVAARDRHMDEAVRYWQVYRRLTKEQE